MDDKHLKGAVSELIAQAWFLENGYEVFVPVVQQSLYDLIVYKDNKFQSVQVKTAYQMWSAKLSYNLVRLGRSKKLGNGKETRGYKEDERFDLLFVVKGKDKWLLTWEQMPKKKTIYFNGNNRIAGYNSDDWLVD
jgi:hypothetical protein